MKRNMNNNSLHTWYNNVLPDLSKREGDVLKAIILLEKATCYQVARQLGCFPHTISGRFTALVKKRKIECVGTVYLNERPHSVYAPLTEGKEAAA